MLIYTKNGIKAVQSQEEVPYWVNRDDGSVLRSLCCPDRERYDKGANLDHIFGNSCDYE